MLTTAMGVGGIPFDVVLFEFNNRTMLGVVFDSNEPYTAIFDYDKLKNGVIEFVKNSWRGDVFDEELKKYLDVAKDLT